MFLLSLTKIGNYSIVIMNTKMRGFEDMLNDLKKLIAIPSVMGEAEEGAPFGKAPRAALDCFLEIAASYGLKTHNENGYCGWAELGDGKGMLGILGHLDVVPAGDGWSNEPYSMVCEDGLIKGRGVADDKGPTVAALHALKRLKESGKKLNNRIRLIVGCNEENGSECIEYYREHCEIPKASFVPDADFPIINSEKGILHLTLTFPYSTSIAENFVSVKAGLRHNIVPDICTAVLPKTGKLFKTVGALGSDSSLFLNPKVAKIIIDGGMRPQDFSAHFFPDRIALEARGVAGHAMCPEKGENAAMKMLALLCGIMGEYAPEEFKAVTKYLCAPNPAPLLGIEAQDDVSGNLTVNTGILTVADGKLTVALDLRLPVCANHEMVKKKIRECLPSATLTENRWSPNLYIPENSKLVQALLSAYAETTGGEKKCLYCGGGTYARELPNAVAFGPTFPNLETNIHNVDESFPFELFNKLPDIYEAAILKLDEAYA